MSLEIREKNSFYLYSSWKNCFSNAWFSGLTDDCEFLKEGFQEPIKKTFYEYRKKCGLGKRLTKFQLRDCFKDMYKVFDALLEDVGDQKTDDDDVISFQFRCKELNEKFKNLKH